MILKKDLVEVIFILIPSDNNFEPGTWRLRVDDNGTPPIDGGGGGEADLSLSYCGCCR